MKIRIHQPLSFLWAIILFMALLLSGKSAFSTELIVNGGFENGSGWTGWQDEVNGTNQTDGWWSANNLFGAHSGSRYQYIGASVNEAVEANNVDGQIYQTITIPANATSATLSYWIKISTNDFPSNAYDILSVEIQGSSGSTGVTYSNQNADQFSSWTQQSLPDLSSYAGQTVRVVFRGITDVSFLTVFRIDDVSFQVTVPNTSTPTVQMSAASSVTTSSAVMNASINPNGLSTNMYFEYGATTGYGSTTGLGAVGSSNTLISMVATLNGLSSNTTYHYRAVATNSGGTSVGSDVSFTTSATGALITRYRLYNEGTKEHLYTTDLNEYFVLSTGGGWLAEGAIYRLFQGAGSLSGVAAVPYYRLYNPASHQHHWTTDLNEYNVLGTLGWSKEGVDGYILPTAATGTLPLYRLYLNAFGGLHLWTTDANERNVLTTSGGWVNEGVAGYVSPLQ